LKFLIRIKELNTFFQDWLAFVQGGVQLTIQGKLQFENGGAPLEQENFAFCKVKLFLVRKKKKILGGQTTKLLNEVDGLNSSSAISDISCTFLSGA